MCIMCSKHIESFRIYWKIWEKWSTVETLWARPRTVVRILEASMCMNIGYYSQGMLLRKQWYGSRSLIQDI